MLLAVGLEPRSLRPRLLLVGLEGLFHQGAHAGHPVRASVAVPVVVDPLQQFVRQSDRQRGAFVVAHAAPSRRARSINASAADSKSIRSSSSSGVPSFSLSAASHPTMCPWISLNLAS